MFVESHTKNLTNKSNSLRFVRFEAFLHIPFQHLETKMHVAGGSTVSCSKAKGSDGECLSVHVQISRSQSANDTKMIINQILYKF